MKKSKRKIKKDKLNDPIRNQLREFLRDRGITYKAAAEGAGMPTNSFYMYMNGYVNLSLEKLYKLLDFLHAELRIVSKFGSKKKLKPLKEHNNEIDQERDSSDEDDEQ